MFWEVLYYSRSNYYYPISLRVYCFDVPFGKQNQIGVRNAENDICERKNDLQNTTNFYKEKTATKIVVTRARWIKHCICGYGAKSLDELIQNDYNAVKTEKVSDVIWFY